MILTKIIITITLVFFLSWIAEKIDTKIAGIIAGMPLGALLVFGFIGNKMGPAFVAESASFAIPGITGTLCFAITYYYVSKNNIPFNPFFSSIAGIVIYFCIALGLSYVPFNLYNGIIFSVIGIMFAILLLRRIPDYKIKNPTQLTIYQIFFRACLSALTVISITEFANELGPRWSGLLVGFPITFLPFLLVIHINYDKQYAHTIIKNFPLGLGGLISFLIVLATSVHTLNFSFSIVVAITASIAYLLILNHFVKK